MAQISEVRQRAVSAGAIVLIGAAAWALLVAGPTAAQEADDDHVLTTQQPATTVTPPTVAGATTTAPPAVAGAAVERPPGAGQAPPGAVAAAEVVRPPAGVVEAAEVARPAAVAGAEEERGLRIGPLAITGSGLTIPATIAAVVLLVIGSAATLDARRRRLAATP